MREIDKKEKPADKPIVKEQSGYYETNERYEMIDGIRYDFQASPKVAHQIVASEIHLAIRMGCHADGLILSAPMDVYLDNENVVQPDIIFIRNDNLHIIRDGWVKGIPDLLVEVLSPSTGKHDLFHKKTLYERFGVKEYWIADPVYAVVYQYKLEDGSYKPPAAHSDKDTLVSEHFPCIRIDLADVFKAIERFREQ
ncbi:MAG TPA: Uma2 family endonuclease [Bacilli bacterium]